MSADTIPVLGVDDLEEHLDRLISDPDRPLEVKLFDHVELQMTDANILPLIPRLLPKITDILRRYQHDPTPLCSLATKLLGPLTFIQVMSLASEEVLIQALRSPAPPANLLAMTVLAKAAGSPGDAAVLAAMKDIITTFLTQWLSTPHVGVGEKGSRVLGDLLDVDSDIRPPQGLAVSGAEIAVRRPPGQGFMWRRVFNDRDVYGLILSLCSNGPHQGVQVGLSPHQLSLAQGRLLRLLPRLSALNFTAVTKTNIPDLHQRYANSEGAGGLLYFAALHMVDKDDVLMHLSLIDFFEALLSIQHITPFSTYKTDTLRTLYREATQRDDTLKRAILSLPERTVPDEADGLRQFIHDISTW
ncbi:hypothetical protein SAMD00023353_2400810 [Rosellinia necatrix]|uniref:DNA mismatch repair protein HSM3 N-terminal domain-containing protein n=1 Tax=Rosellinia necatrix TaxID=77044 RepID=A0A1W2TFT3_ROSNE|nr:hypothetical protein SAMD00023353_2400810 [Rosellinia necatrix]